MFGGSTKSSEFLGDTDIIFFERFGSALWQNANDLIPYTVDSPERQLVLAIRSSG
jgi:hypothetical protein